MIAATILLFILSVVVYFFTLRTATERKDVNRAAPALVTFALLALLTAFFALGDLFDALLPRTLEPVRTFAEVESQEPFVPEDSVLLVGEAADDTRAGVRNMFNIDLEGGAYAVQGSAYQTWDWPEDTSGDEPVSYLDEGQDVVVLARGTDDGNLVSRYIYAGTYDSYQDFHPQFTTVPIVTIVLSMLLVLLNIGALLFHRWRLK